MKSGVSSVLHYMKMKKEYLRLKDALNQVEQTGYGIVMPTVDELSLPFRYSHVLYRLRRGLLFYFPVYIPVFN